MLILQTGSAGIAKLEFDPDTGKFDVTVYPAGAKAIRKSYRFYKRAARALMRYRKKYGIG